MIKANHKRQWYISIDCGPPRPTSNQPEDLPWPIFIVAITEKACFLDVRTFTTEDPAQVCGLALKSAIDKYGVPDRLVYDLATAAFSRAIRRCAAQFNIQLASDPLYHAAMLERLLRQGNRCGQCFNSIEQFDQILQKWVQNYNRNRHPSWTKPKRK